MKITRKNYEAYFLDFYEKNLSPEQVAELFVFLEQNPDLKEEFESFENIGLVADENIRFEPKKALKKNELIPTDHIHAGNYEEYLVRDLEGDLSEDENIEMRAFIEINPKTKLEYNIYRSTFLKPDNSIRFENKEKLKKTGFFVIHRREVIAGFSIAATIILLLGIYFGFLEKPEQRDSANKVEKLKPILFDGSSNQKMTSAQSYFPGNIEARKITGIEPSGIAANENPDRPKLSPIAGLQPRPVKTIEWVRTDMILDHPELRNSEFALQSDDLKTPGQRSFASRFLAGLVSKVIRVDMPKRKSFLEYTIEGYNFIADKEVELQKTVDVSGHVIAYSLNGQNLSFSRNRETAKE